MLSSKHWLIWKEIKTYIIYAGYVQWWNMTHKKKVVKFKIIVQRLKVELKSLK